MDSEAWRATIYGVAKNWTQLSDWTKLNWTPLKTPSSKTATVLEVLEVESGFQHMNSWATQVFRL